MKPFKRSVSLIIALSLHVSGVLSAPGNEVKARQACTQLQAQLGGDVIQLPSSGEYTTIATGSYSRFNGQAQPACIAVPRHSSDVQAVMQKIFSEKLKYAVRAGGHSSMPGWNR